MSTFSARVSECLAKTRTAFGGISLHSWGDTTRKYSAFPWGRAGADPIPARSPVHSRPAVGSVLFWPRIRQRRSSLALVDWSANTRSAERPFSLLANPRIGEPLIQSIGEDNFMWRGTARPRVPRSRKLPVNPRFTGTPNPKQVTLDELLALQRPLLKAVATV